MPVLAKNSEKAPTISEVFVDLFDEEIIVVGSDFNDPSVSLGEEGLLNVIEDTTSEIHVELPAIPDGDYTLTVSQGKYQVSYDLTIDSSSIHNHAGTYLPVGSTLACGSGYVVTGILANGSVICTDAGSNHNHAGTYLPVGSTLACGSGEKVTGILANGNVVCADDEDTTYDAQIADLTARIEALEALHP
jgi:hypothetical protein